MQTLKNSATDLRSYKPQTFYKYLLDPYKEMIIIENQDLIATGRQLVRSSWIEITMDQYNVFPNPPIVSRGIISEKFIDLGVTTFWIACEYVHRLPYGYNSDRNDIMILFKEGYGTCSTKHAVIAVLAEELAIPVVRMFGIYAMKEDLVTGTNNILAKYNLPFVPMIHCFLAHGHQQVDLTEGNDNGKNRPIKDFLFTKNVSPDISEAGEYHVYRKALENLILTRKEMKGIKILDVLRARTEGVALLKSRVVRNTSILPLPQAD